jgi:hypothetical protein
MLNTEILHNPAIPPYRYVPERNVFFYKKSTQMVMLTAALFGIAQK